MSIHQAAIALTLYAIVLTNCSVINESFVDVNQNGQNQSSDSALPVQNNTKTFAAAQNPGFATQTVYFLPESSEIEPSFIPLIEKQIQDLQSNPDAILVLEGHADERGSREYNIALAEERAKSVAKIIQARGILVSQLEIVSYGEEKPASHERNPYLNQRVNLIFQRIQK